MKQFFKFVLATFTGIILTCILSVLLLVIIAAMADKKVVVKPNSLLHIKLDAPVVDRADDNPFSSLNPFSGNSEKPLGLKSDILDNLEKAKTDENIKGIFLDLGSVNAGFGMLEEIRAAIIDFKTSGKFVLAYSEMYSQKAYYIASAADEVYLYPEGALDFKGLNSEIMFLKGMLEKLEVEAQIIRGPNNKFKSAVEPLMYDHMSDANKEQTKTYLYSIWNHILKAVSESRNISVDELNQIADSMYIRKASDAVKYKLIDATLYTDELLAKLKEKTGTEKGEKIKYVTLKKYSKAQKEEDKEEGSYGKSKIAVIYAQGSIESGEGDNNTIGSDRIAKAIREAREDEKVKAIVLRVNSPGGSALASDVMWREMILAKEAKPVIVSMADVAASGGYYIACAADTILANENTITGSIGVFGVLPNLKGFFNNKLGITFDGVKTNSYSDLGTTSRALSTGEFSIIQQGVVEVYDAFITKVSTGRGITKDMVDSIGQGRVWSGVDGKKIGLVDMHGGINKAIEIAAQKAGLEDYKVSYLPKKEDPFERFMKELSGESEAKIIQNALGENYRMYEYLKSIKEMKGVQARMPYYMEIY
jgi:protease IV